MTVAKDRRCLAGSQKWTRVENGDWLWLEELRQNKSLVPSCIAKTKTSRSAVEELTGIQYGRVTSKKN